MSKPLHPTEALAALDLLLTQVSKTTAGVPSDLGAPFRLCAASLDNPELALQNWIACQIHLAYFHDYVQSLQETEALIAEAAGFLKAGLTLTCTDTSRPEVYWENLPDLSPAASPAPTD